MTEPNPPTVPFTDQISGLAPLDGGAFDGTDDGPRAPRPGYSVMIATDRLHPHPDNIREDLGDVTETAESMRVHGVLQPLVVVPHPTKAGHYYVIGGNRRLKSAREAGLARVPAMIRLADIGPAKAIQIMLVENCMREELNAMEKALAMGRLRDEFGLRASRIAKSIGMTETTVSAYLTLLELDRPTQARVRDGRLAMSTAVAAVRRTRAAERRRRGYADQGAARARTWEPDHFSDRHPLARKAAALCDAREHNLRRRIGRVACGQCWETVIRRDERVVDEAAGTS